MVVPIAPSMMAIRLSSIFSSGCCWAFIMSPDGRAWRYWRYPRSSVTSAVSFVCCCSLCEYASFVFVRRDGVGHGQRRDEQVFLAHHQCRRVQAGEFEAMTVSDRIGWAGFDAVAAEDASVVVDVVDLRVAFGGGDADALSVFRGFDIDAVGRAGGGAEETGDTLLEAVLIALELVLAAESFLKLGTAQRAGAVGIVFHLGRLEHLPEGDAHTLGDGCGVLDDGHRSSIRRGAGQAATLRLRLRLGIGGVDVIHFHAWLRTHLAAPFSGRFLSPPRPASLSPMRGCLPSLRRLETMLPLPRRRSSCIPPRSARLMLRLCWQRPATKSWSIRPLDFRAQS